VLQRRIFAASARWDSRVNRWVFDDGWQRTFTGETVASYQPFTVATFPEIREQPSYFKKENIPSQEMSYSELSRYISDLKQSGFDTNLFGVVALTQSLLPLLRKSNAGRIVNLSSILASSTLHATKGSPIYDSKTFAYDASKTALNSFTIHLAHELADTSIKVNSADPGWVKTDMGGEGAMLEIVDGAKTSVRLATLSEDGPTGGYFHLGETLPW
jgi:NAD(P)-dependent dehydrogenase (short-subunit alcohol dehydrogenase family)